MQMVVGSEIPEKTNQDGARPVSTQTGGCGGWKYDELKYYLTGIGRITEYDRQQKIATVEGQFQKGKLHGLGRVVNHLTRTC